MSLTDVIVAIIAVLVFGISYTVIFLDFVKYAVKFEKEKTYEEEYCPTEESED
jgi:hypothetical protein